MTYLPFLRIRGVLDLVVFSFPRYSRVITIQLTMQQKFP